MKLTQILAIVFVVLLVPTGIKFFTGGVAYMPDERPKLWDGIVKDNIAMIRLSKPKVDDQGKPVMGPDGKPAIESLVFQRQEDDWVIASGLFRGKLKARGSEVESRILDPVTKIEVTESTIINPQADEATLKSYGLGEDEAVRLELFNAASQKPVATALIGRAAGGAELGASATSGQYVRKPDQKVVILADDDLTFEVGEDSWANKTLQDIDESEIVGLSLRNEKGEVEFKREAKDKPWTTVKSPAEVGKQRDNEITSLLGRARYVSVQDFARDIVQGKPVKHGLDAPRIEVTVKTKDGKAHVLRVGKKVEGKQESYAILMDTREVPFTLADWDVTYFEKDPKDFFDLKPKPPAKKEDGDKTPKKETPKKAPPKKETPKKAPPKKETPKKAPPKKAPPKKAPPKKGDGK